MVPSDAEPVPEVRAPSPGRVVDSVSRLVGQTPVVELRNVVPDDAARVFAKCEFTNPGGSVKDRIALSMLRDAEESGALEKGGTVIEPTAGNTGIGLAMIGVALGYRVILVVPERYSREKMRLMQALGGELELTPSEGGMAYAIDRAHELADEIPGGYVPQQFANPANPRAHYESTGPELLAQLDGRIDALVIGASTGGTFSGTTRYVKESVPGCEAVLVEPQGSVFGGGEAGEHRVEGIGATFVPDTLDLELADEIVMVEDDPAFEMVRRLGREEGLLVGSSSGAAVQAACWTAERMGPGCRVATIIPDSGERYISQGIYPDPLDRRS